MIAIVHGSGSDHHELINRFYGDMITKVAFADKERHSRDYDLDSLRSRSGLTLCRIRCI